MRNVNLILGFLIILYSCEKDNSSVNNSKSTYLPIAVGNFWVYQNYNLDSAGNETIDKSRDSIIVSKDTLINDLKYYRFDKYNIYSSSDINWVRIESSDYYRDSAKNFINKKGEIFFSEVNFKDTLLRRFYDTIMKVTYKMVKISDKISVPTGTYKSVLSLRGTVYTNFYINQINPRYTNTYYADGVGKILNTKIYSISSEGIVQKLIRYNLK